MKKLVVLLLTVCLLISSVACVAYGEDQGTGPSYKFIFMYYTFADKLGSQFKSCMEYLGEAFNVEFQFIEGSLDEEGLAAIEAAVAKGDLDGIMVVASASPALLTIAGDIPVLAVCNAPASEEMVAEAAVFSNYLGAIYDSDYQVGYAAAQGLYDAGCRKVCLAGLTQGLTKSHDDRATAFIDFVNEKEDMELLADNYSYGLMVEAIGSFAAAYPELDGIFCTYGTDAILNAMRTEGLVGYAKLATVDVSSETGTYFDNGTLVWTAGGQYGTAMVAFAIMYNYVIDGTRIIPDPIVSMIRPFIQINGSDAFRNYVTYVDSGEFVYSADEVRDMIHYYNSEADYDYFIELGENYNLEDIQARHGE